MTGTRRRLLEVVGAIAGEDDGDVSLRALARGAGWSPFHLQRAFKRLTGESPKRFAERVRLERAAAELLASETSILAVALDAGFAGPEVFARAFRRRFGCSPRAFRSAARLDPAHAARHRSVIRSVSPCVGLYRVSLEEETCRMPTLALLWYVSGAVTIQLAQLGRLPGIDAGEAAYYAAKPAWKIVLTAVTTYGSVLAALLLLMRRKASAMLFAVMLALILVGNVVELADGTSRASANNAAAIATAAIFAIAVLMTWYTRAMQRRGVLR